jgi:hypothetical protein
MVRDIDSWSAIRSLLMAQSSHGRLKEIG